MLELTDKNMCLQNNASKTSKTCMSFNSYRPLSKCIIHDIAYGYESPRVAVVIYHVPLWDRSVTVNARELRLNFVAGFLNV